MDEPSSLVGNTVDDSQESQPVVVFDPLPRSNVEAASLGPDGMGDLNEKMAKFDGELKRVFAKYSIDESDAMVDPEELPKEVQQVVEQGAALSSVMFARQNCLLNLRFSIEGRIVNQDGDPVRDAKLQVARYGFRIDPISGPENASDEEVLTLADGHFHFVVEGGTSIILMFPEKQGYYPVRDKIEVSLSDEERDRLGDAAIKGTLALEDGRVPLVRHGLKVVMHEIKQPTTLDVYFGRLRVSADDSGATFTIGESPGATQPEPEVPVANVQQLEKVPDHSLVLIPAVDNDGRITKFVKQRDQPIPDTFPQSFRLLMKGDETSGFRLIDPRKATPYDQNFGRTAPPDGYVPEIDFDEETLSITRNFFVRMRGKFGRGTFGRFRFTDDGRTVEADFAIMLQPDGSRNLDAQIGRVPSNLILW